MSDSEIIAHLPIEWSILLSPVIKTEKFSILENTILSSEKNVYPPINEIFQAYQDNAIQQIKVVIIGQDPYHGFGQAHGLSFSVKHGNRQPPSLKNIFKELEADLGIPIPNKFTGNLSQWSKQGVFLINSVLTVENAKPNSHKNLGWEEFTDQTIQLISSLQNNVVFVLWGKFAQKKEALIDASKHLIIKSAHPSPFSARNGFFGSKPFSKTNTYLNQTNQKPINWAIK